MSNSWGSAGPPKQRGQTSSRRRPASIRPVGERPRRRAHVQDSRWPPWRQGVWRHPTDRDSTGDDRRRRDAARPVGDGAITRRPRRVADPSQQSACGRSHPRPQSLQGTGQVKRGSCSLRMVPPRPPWSPEVGAVDADRDLDAVLRRALVEQPATVVLDGGTLR